MGSKSTFTGASLGGHQGRALVPGDLLTIDSSSTRSIRALPIEAIPQWSNEWTIEMCPGAQWDPAFLSSEGMEAILKSEWKVSAASNRSGVRLDGPRIKWARSSGGEGGSHPSNVIDQG